MNPSDQKRLKELLQQWYDHTLPHYLEKELLDLFQRSEGEEQLTAEMQKLWEEREPEAVFSDAQKEKMLTAITNNRQPNRFPIRYVMAAAILLTAVVTGILLWQQRTAGKMVAVKRAGAPAQENDIKAPAGNKAILTLADGRRIVLENQDEGTLAREGSVEVMKTGDGQLVYEGQATEVQWNTLTVPKGSQPVHLTLADGSRVTLNVASSLTFPTAFTGNDRRVTMTGEAYFEVAKLPVDKGSGKVPFTVSLHGMSVEVTGTRFNVNAYEDEAAIKTTLMEGAVNIIADDQRQAIVPGEQAIVSPDKRIRLNKNADLEEAVAWINGKFRFNSADVETVMRQVARWYDVEVKFAARPRMRFGGQIDRNSTLRQMFAILEASGLHFSLSGKTVTILP